jgi:hypothetical protein
MKTVGTGRRNLYLLLVIAATGMLIWLYSRYVLLIISGIYVTHGIVWYLWSLIQPRRSLSREDRAGEFPSENPN